MRRESDCVNLRCKVTTSRKWRDFFLDYAVDHCRHTNVKVGRTSRSVLPAIFNQEQENNSKVHRPDFP